MSHFQALRFWYIMRDLYANKNDQLIVMRIDNLIERILNYLHKNKILLDF